MPAVAGDLAHLPHRSFFAGDLQGDTAFGPIFDGSLDPVLDDLDNLAMVRDEQALVEQTGPVRLSHARGEIIRIDRAEIPVVDRERGGVRHAAFQGSEEVLFHGFHLGGIILCGIRMSPVQQGQC